MIEATFIILTREDFRKFYPDAIRQPKDKSINDLSLKDFFIQNHAVFNADIIIFKDGNDVKMFKNRKGEGFNWKNFEKSIFIDINEKPEPIKTTENKNLFLDID